ncbi:GW domain-containing glycosaminoglycan-binding protein [Carnobacterium antarcticum]|uniref:GW domain-containing glycosaminoglycan-binding protein n=1 Tax=Carnobacterium antarcticum TaxID=2126436 RepID=A0ABW4NM39_9LACT|nr:GW domain-containing glycosaminoglycan-binding protein [Carnobacterium sp. CP1]ALV21564.1 N-acetylmuramoyl-L-alanine amidase [Carnobacterium sp. CP1]
MKKRYKATLVLGIASFGVIGLMQPSASVEAAVSVQSNQYPKVNTYIKQQNLRTAKITQSYKQFLQFDYRNGNGAAEGIVIHETANPNSTITSEINYMTINWQNAFVHAFVDKDNIIQIHPADFAVWGAGKQANPRFYQIELVEHDTFHQFAQSVNNDAYLAAYMLYYFDLEPSRATKGGSGTIWTHDEVSRYLGGTDHTDPVGYFAKWGYTVSDFYNLVVEKYNAMPNQIFKEDNLNRQYAVPVDPKNYGIWNGPYPGNGSAKVGELHSYANQPIVVYKEVRTKNGDWVQFGQNGKVIGWVGKTGIQITPAVSTPVTNAYDYGVWDSYQRGMKRVTGLSDFAGKEIKVTKEATANNGVEWVEFSSNNKVIGWVAKKGIAIGLTPSQVPQNISKKGTPVPNAYDFGVWNDYEKGNTRVAGLSEYAGKSVQVVKEVISSTGVKWVQFSVDGKIIGWVAESGIRYVSVPKEVSKAGTPVPNAYDFGVWNDYEPGNKRVAGLSEYAGKSIKVIKEVLSSTGVKWVQFSADGKVIGWVAETGIRYGEAPKEVSKLGTPVPNAYDFGIWNDYEAGNTRVAGLSEYAGKPVKVIKEIVSSAGVKWVQFSVDGTVIGWVAETGIRYGAVPQEVSKIGTPVPNAYNYGVWNDYEPGNTRVAGLSAFAGKQVGVVAEVTSSIGVKWVQFSVDGEVVGWVAETGIRYGEVPQSVSKTGTPVSNAYDFGVWNDYEAGNTRVTGLSAFSGKQLEVIKEVISSSGVKWVQFSADGEVIGWVAETGIQYGEIPQTVSKLGTPVANVYDFGVWNDYEAGNTRVTELSAFSGKQLEVIKEVVSLNGVKWVQFSADGEVIGWVAETSIQYGEIPQTISKLGTPVQNAYDFGVWNDYEQNREKVAGLSEFSGQQLEITKEVESSSGEALVQFSLDGEEVGWVAETGIQYGEIPQTISKLGTPVTNAYDFGVWNDYEQNRERVAGLSEFFGQQLEITKEVESTTGEKLVQFSLDGEEIGWVAETGIQYGEIPKIVSKQGTPVPNAADFGVWNNYEAGNTKITGLSDFSGKEVEITKEAFSSDGVKWVQISIEGTEIGWVVESAIQ